MMTLLLTLALLWPFVVMAHAVWRSYRTPSAQRDYFSVWWLSAA